MATRTISVAFALLLAQSAVAAPVQYSFTTGGTNGSFSSTPPLSTFAGSFISGTFTYDAAALAVIPEPRTDGGTSYRGFTPESVNGFVSSFTSLSATVGGFSFSDVSGSTVVGNDIIPQGSSFPTPVDFLQISADPGPGSTSPSNLTGFSTGGFTLVNVRMFWIESQATPEFITDYLSNNSLPAVLPSFHGRLALDFASSTNLSGPRGSIFFDRLSVSPVSPVPEPETYALLVAGLGLVGFAVRRQRKESQ